MSQQPHLYRITRAGHAALAKPPEGDRVRTRQRQRFDKARWDITAAGWAVLDVAPQRQESAS
jgi:hypothetical protein